MVIAKFQFCHGNVNNAPRQVSIAASYPVLAPRTFLGMGAPAAGTLNAGNGKYCGPTSGAVLAATLVNGGAGYSVGYVIPVNGGVFSTPTQITVEAVGPNGAVVDFRVSQTGVYTTFPANPVTTTAGAGAGATFDLAIQPPDFYWDLTNKNLYICTAGGTNATSSWQKINTAPGGGGGYSGTWSQANAYTVGQIVRVTSVYIDPASQVSSTIGVFGCVTAIPNPPGITTGNMIPQFPEPVAGVKYWELISLGVQALSSCQNGTVNIWIQASAPF